MSDSDMSDDIWKINLLMGALSKAFWERFFASGEDYKDAYSRLTDDPYPESDKESALWRELSSPENHEALKSYLKRYHTGKGDWAKLYDRLLAESEKRQAEK